MPSHSAPDDDSRPRATEQIVNHVTRTMPSTSFLPFSPPRTEYILLPSVSSQTRRDDPHCAVNPKVRSECCR